MNYNSALNHLRKMGNPRDKEGMSRFGIDTKHALGIRITKLRKFAQEIGTDHELALKLWESGIHEARMLASMIDDLNQVTIEQMENWADDFNSWDLCDTVCGTLFDKTKFAYEIAVEWTERNKEFVKRAGFAIMAWLAVHDKNAPDKSFFIFFNAIKQQSGDDRIYVKKAINWALRQIGKRNLVLHELALETAEEILTLNTKSGNWIAKDAIRELKREKVINRLRENE